MQLVQKQVDSLLGKTVFGGLFFFFPCRLW